MARIKSELAFRNAIKAARAFPKAPLVPGLASERPKGPTMRSLLKSILRRPADHIRRYLNGTIYAKLDTLHGIVGSAEQNVAAIHRKLDNIVTRLDAIELRSFPPLLIDDATFAIRIADGYVAVPRSDERLVVMLTDAPAGGLEPGTRGVIRRMLGPGMTFVDIGASIGIHTLAAARRVGRNGRVLSFEPTPVVFSALQRTIAINELNDRVCLKQVALGARAEERILYIFQTGGHNSLFKSPSVNDDESVTVTVAPLDELLPGDVKVDLIKIDVEGAELEVLRGMTNTIRGNPRMAIIAELGPAHLERTGVTGSDWFEEFAKLGFVAYGIDEGDGTLRRVFYEDVAAKTSTNVLFVPTNYTGPL